MNAYDIMPASTMKGWNAMVMSAAANSARQTNPELRPMDPTRDLGTIARLIEGAFAGELDSRGRAALREMRWMSRLSPLVWWWAQADPGFRESFGGFVWEEPSPRRKGRRIVGNVSLNRAPGAQRRWAICNVVVQPQYRHQGIGRRLTEAAIAEARQLGAQTVILQVHEDNPVALRLYTRLGFEQAAAEAMLRLRAEQLPAAARQAPAGVPGYQLRAWQPEDGKAALDLARLVTPSVLQWLKPIRSGEYQLGWWDLLAQRVADLISGRRVYRMVAHEAGSLVALMTISAAIRNGEQGVAHRLALLVHPDHAGQVEPALVSRALHVLAAMPPKPVVVTVDSAHAAANKVLCRHGFTEQRRLLTLTKSV